MLYIHTHTSFYINVRDARSPTSSELSVDVFARRAGGATVNFSDVVRCDEKGICEVHVL
jgi:hypothetical protein